MNVEDLVNSDLFFGGVGTFTGLVMGIMLEGPMRNFLGEWSREGTAGALTIAGSLLMGSGQEELQQIGMGAGTVGVALLGRALFTRVTGQSFFNLNEAGGSNGNGNGEETDQESVMPDEGYLTSVSNLMTL